MDESVVRKGRWRRLGLAAAPGVGLTVTLATNVVVMIQVFTWTGVVLAVVTAPLAVMAFSILRMQLRTEQRITTIRAAQYQALRDFLAANAEYPVFVSRDDEVLILPITSTGGGFIRVDLDEVADARRDGRADATVVGDRFLLEPDCPQVTHDFITLTPFADDDTVVPPLARHTVPDMRSPRTWWRSWRSVRSLNRSGIDIPSDADVDTLITQLHACVT